MDYAAAKQALDCEAVFHLGRLVHWLQQAPCMELHSMPSHYSEPLKMDWLYLLASLHDLTRTMVGAERVVMVACGEQLLSTGRVGERESTAP